MSLLDQLKLNRGTVSSKLGKELAEKVLKGDTKILHEAIKLVLFEPDSVSAKNIRAGSAKIIEKVAEKNPKLVAPHLSKIFPALKMPEPQTRWMLILTFGYCAQENPKIARKAIPFAERFIQERKGVCLSGASEMYLGYIGALSQQDAKKVLAILLKVSNDALINEQDWILEACIRIFDRLNKSDQEKVIAIAQRFRNNPKKSTQNRIGKLMKLFE